MPLELVPITLREANAFVKRYHRHHKPDRGAKFAIGAGRDGVVVGVAVVGRPKSRMLQRGGYTVEVTRMASSETGARLANGHATGVCSFLYAACWRAARAIGYRRLVTYTLPEEGGESLRGAGWTCIGEAGGGSWDRKDRPRIDLHPTQGKLRWERAA